VDLIREISAEFGTAMLYISHNLGLVRQDLRSNHRDGYCGQRLKTGRVAEVFRGMRYRTPGAVRFDSDTNADKHGHPLKAIPGYLATARDRPPGVTLARCTRSSLAGAMRVLFRCLNVDAHTSIDRAVCGCGNRVGTAPGLSVATEYRPWVRSCSK